MDSATRQRIINRSLSVNVTCAGCFFGCAVSSEARGIIEHSRIFKSWSKGTYLFHSGDDAHGIWAVCSGKAKVFQETEQGKYLTLRIVIPGELVGHRSVLAGEPFSASAIAMEDTRTAYLPANIVMKLIEIEPQIRGKLFQHLAGELGRAESLATSMAYNKAEQRLLAALASMCRGCYLGSDDNQTENSEEINILAPRQELAELAGLTVEATVRTLRKLEEIGILKAHGHSIQIFQPEILEHFNSLES